MCIAIYKPADGKISRERLFEAYNANPDGWGVMWSDKDSVECLKGCYDFNSFYSLFRLLENAKKDVVVHFRTASSGSISNEKCHPFYVNKDLAFVENGNLYEYSDCFADKWKDDRTDIQRFNDEVLQKLPVNFLYKPTIRKRLEDYCKGNQTKMVFMDSYGRVAIVNEEAGEWSNGCWYSNGGIENYIGYGYSGAYYYNGGDTRHRGGLFSVQMLPEEKRSEWSRCPECLGYFRNLEGICSGCETWGGILECT